MAKSRTLHTPGAPAAQASEATQESQTGEQASGEVAAEPKAKSKRVLTRDDYAKMHSSEVDPTTLTRSVLCRDGWVTPLPRDKDGKPVTDLLRTPGGA